MRCNSKFIERSEFPKSHNSEFILNNLEMNSHSFVVFGAHGWTQSLLRRIILRYSLYFYKQNLCFHTFLILLDSRGDEVEWGLRNQILMCFIIESWFAADSLNTFTHFSLSVSVLFMLHHKNTFHWCLTASQRYTHTAHIHTALQFTIVTIFHDCDYFSSISISKSVLFLIIGTNDLTKFVFYLTVWFNCNFMS